MRAKWGAGQRQNLVVWGGTHKEQEGQPGGQGAKPGKRHEARWPPGGSTTQLAAHRMGLLGSRGTYSLALNPLLPGAYRGLSIQCLPVTPEPAGQRAASLHHTTRKAARETKSRRGPSFNPARSDLTPAKSRLAGPLPPELPAPPLPAVPPGTAAPGHQPPCSGVFPAAWPQAHPADPA